MTQAVPGSGRPRSGASDTRHIPWDGVYQKTSTAPAIIRIQPKKAIVGQRLRLEA